MPSFITRVELHNARPEDYNTLHEAMIRAKFHKYISDGKDHYELPSAEYYSFGNITAVQVRDLALAAANSTNRANWILVSEYTNAAWSLRKIETNHRNTLAPNPFLQTG